MQKTLRLIRSRISALFSETTSRHLRFPDKMLLRYQGEDSTPEKISELYRQQSNQNDIVFFIHGLMCDDSCWQESQFNMTQAFINDFGVFPILLHYDSGRHISENGLELALLLQELFKYLGNFHGHWHFVGASMGGMVTRSALYQAATAEFSFTKLVDKVFMIAAPNRGAPLEKVVQIAQLMLQSAPYLPFSTTSKGLQMLFENIPLGKKANLAPIGTLTDFFMRKVPTFYMEGLAAILALRSEGIRDLRHGYLLTEEWNKAESWFGLKSNQTAVPPLPWAKYYAITGSLWNKEQTNPSPFNIDGMVTSASGANIGSNDQLKFVENSRYRHIPGVSHFVMPFNQEVYSVLAQWFSEN